MQQLSSHGLWHALSMVLVDCLKIRGVSEKQGLPLQVNKKGYLHPASYSQRLCIKTETAQVACALLWTHTPSASYLEVPHCGFSIPYLCDRWSTVG